MSAPDDHRPRGLRDPRIAAALAADAALAEELGMIVAALEADARERFLAALADQLPRHARPAAAVLVALERAARA